MAILEFPSKDPEEILDYPIDFSTWVVAGAALDSSSVTIESQTPSGGATALMVDSQIELNDIVTIWLSGGSSGVTYVLKVTVTDDNVTPSDRTGVRRVRIKVIEK